MQQLPPGVEGPHGTPRAGEPPDNKVPKKENAIITFCKNIFSTQRETFEEATKNLSRPMTARTVIHWESKTKNLADLDEIQNIVSNKFYKNLTPLTDKQLNRIASLQQMIDDSKEEIKLETKNPILKMKQVLMEYLGYSTTANLESKISDIYSKLNSDDQKAVHNKLHAITPEKKNDEKDDWPVIS